MKKYEVFSKQIFQNVYLVERGKKKLLYAPFKKLAVRDGFMFNLFKKFIRFFPDLSPKPAIIPLPTTVTLDLTHGCPLGCVYCSVDSGRDTKIMEEDVGKTAIDVIVENAKNLGVKEIGVVFGGGGEPTLPFSLLQKLVVYTWKRSKKENLKPIILSATGGILSSRQIKWLVENVTHIALSFDGSREVQNRQRPLRNGGESFEIVVKTAKLLGKLGADFSIRAAISNLNSDLTALVKFFSQFHPKFLNFQPVVICGRCYKTGWRGVEPDKFIEEFIKAQKISSQLRVPIIFPGTNIRRLIPEVCHAYNGTGFVVSSWGLVSACERVLYPNDSLADIFIYGKIEGRKLLIDEEKLKRLKKIRVEKIPYCVNCFARWHCQGGCLNEHLSQNKNRSFYSKRIHPMCYITRALVWYQLTY